MPDGSGYPPIKFNVGTVAIHIVQSGSLPNDQQHTFWDIDQNER